MTIKAIDTHYAGYKFRSRLEARWGVCFDALGVAWEYEPEGFELPNGDWYLPDFWLPLEPHGDYTVAGLWVEIKPTMPAAKEVEKMKLLAMATGHHGAILSGIPGDHSVTKVLHQDGVVFTLSERKDSTTDFDWPLPHELYPLRQFHEAAAEARSIRFEHGATR